MAKRIKKSVSATEEFTLYMAGLTPSESSLFDWDHVRNPMHVLISFAYHNHFDELFSRFSLKDAPGIMLDSGAYTVWNVEGTVSLDAYIAYVLEGPFAKYFTEVVALDVIGDAKASYENAMEMERQGVNVVPVFHYGEPLKYLRKYCQQWEKVGLGSMNAPTRAARTHWRDSVFNYAYPHKFHSFGYASEPLLQKYPFQSADSTSWITGGPRWGRWDCDLSGAAKGFGRIRGAEARAAIPMNVISGLKLEKELCAKWKHEIQNRQSAPKFSQK